MTDPSPHRLPPPPPSFQSQHVVANGLRFHVVAGGPSDGPPVLFLHGFPEFWYSWRHQMIALASAGYRVFAPDLRGYGSSDKPAGVAAYTMDALLSDVVGLVDALGCGPVTLVGHDWGGTIAWTTAASPSHRHVVRRLAVMNAPHPAAFLRNLTAAQLRRSWYMLFFQLPALPERALSRDDYRNLRRTLTRAAVRPDTFTATDLDFYVAAMSQPGALSSALNYYRGLLRINPVAALGRLRPIPTDLPALLVWGERDLALGVELTHNLGRYAENLRIEYIADAGHWVQQEAPDAVNRALLSFLPATSRAADALPPTSSLPPTPPPRSQPAR